MIKKIPDTQPSSTLDQAPEASAKTGAEPRLSPSRERRYPRTAPTLAQQLEDCEDALNAALNRMELLEQHLDYAATILQGLAEGTNKFSETEKESLVRQATVYRSIAGYAP